MGKSVNLIIVMCMIFGLLLIGIQISDGVNAQPPVTLPVITISSDGSILSSLSPSPIINEGNIYVITENISGYGIDIQCSNLLLLGEGNTLQATAEYNTNSGITIESSGVMVENVSIAAFYVGVDVKGSSNKVTGCIITAYDNGINVEGQSDSITENLISDCGGSGIELSNSLNNVNYNTINCPDGVCVTVDNGSNNNTISGNLLNSGTFDIWMFGNSNNVTSNTITGGADSIDLWNSAGSNIFCKNDIINNYEGVGLDEQSNAFYLNNFVNNTYDVRLHILSDPYAPYSMNIFDNGSIGNYWGDYTSKYPNAKEIDNTGIFNTPYVIDGNITDSYPLTTSYNVGNTGKEISTLSSPNPTSTPRIPEFPTLILIFPFLLLATLLGAVIIKRKQLVGWIV